MSSVKRAPAIALKSHWDTRNGDRGDPPRSRGLSMDGRVAFRRSTEIKSLSRNQFSDARGKPRISADSLCTRDASSPRVVVSTIGLLLVRDSPSLPPSKQLLSAAKEFRRIARSRAICLVIIVRYSPRRVIRYSWVEGGGRPNSPEEFRIPRRI